MGQENKTFTEQQPQMNEGEPVIVTNVDTLRGDKKRMAELVEGDALPVYGLGTLGIRSLGELPSDPDIKARLGIK